MADKMMRVAGRTSDGVAKPVLVDTSGSQTVNRKWTIKNNTMADVEIRDTSSHYAINTNAVDLSEYTISSLRILNALDADVTIFMLYDGNRDNTRWLKDANNYLYEVTIPAGANSWFIITPNDWDALNYVQYLKLQYSAKTTPTSGSLQIVHVGRK